MAATISATQTRELAKLNRLGRASSMVPARTRNALVHAGLVREVPKPAGVIGAFGRALTDTVWVEITDKGLAAIAK
jgi:hypothetical protein